jgi:transposase
MWQAAPVLVLNDEQRKTLQAWVAARNTPQKVVFRSRIILRASAQPSNRAIARQFRTTRDTVILWRKRFTWGGTAALTEEAPGRGRKPAIDTAQVKRIVEATLHTTPPNATHWTVRTMAKAHGVSPATGHRIWDAHGLQPHRVKTFKLSTDKQFVEKLTDVVGLYLKPPDKALVLCVDEKSQIQALDRTQPGLPLKRGRCGTYTHDYRRHGTTTLFAARNVLDGTVIGECLPRHRHQEFLKFLRQIDRRTPDELDLHLIIDNYATHTHPRVKHWLAKHRRFHLHPTPTASSWLNLIERWFRELSQKRLRRGTFHSVRELVDAIERYVGENNRQPRPFVWTASVEKILTKVRHCRAIFETLH